jgi:hypothetical protein
MTVACDDMNSIIQDDLDRGEAIYPGRPGYSKPVEDVFPGIRKAWIHWATGADPRVVKTVITYTFNGETKSVEKPVVENDNPYLSYKADSLLIENLAEGHYSFSMHTIDKEGHRSVSTVLYPQIVQVYGDIYLNSLTARSISMMDMQPGGNLLVTWSKASPEVLYSLVEYQDYSEIPGGKTKVDTVFNDSITSLLTGFKRFRNFSVKSYLRVGVDVAPIEDSYAPPVVEKALLETPPNGFTELTAAKATLITELTYPFGMAGWTFQDLYYFPNLHTLDLTPGTDALPQWKYYKYYADRRSDAEGYDTTKYTSIVGGCPWVNFVSGYMSDSDIAIIDDLLRTGELSTVKYTRNSYPKLDAVLSQYNSRIDWIPAEPLPDYGVLIPNSLLVDYRVEDRNKGVSIDNNAVFSYSETGSNVPADIAAKFNGAKLNNVYKVSVVNNGRDENKSGANVIAFAVPAGYQLGYAPNGRLEFDCYIDTPDKEYSWIKPEGISKYEVWKEIRFFNSRKLSNNYPDDSPYPEADYPYVSSHRSGTFESQPAKDKFFAFTDAELGAWKSFDITAYNENFESMATGHYRVIRIQLGHEAAGTPWPLPAGQSLTYYIANLRWSK